MAIDYSSHPSKLAKAGELGNAVNIKALRDAIPSHCWQPLYRWAVWYTIRDILLVGTFGWLAYNFIPIVEPPLLRWSLWVAYGYVQGLFMTGVWVLGHECGHSAFSPSETFNHTAGFVFHSFLLTPYFSWRSSHRRHHIYANNLAKDHTYVPPVRSAYQSMLRQKFDRIENTAEDSPIYTLLRLILQQLVGWPWYLLTNITASRGSLYGSHSSRIMGSSHFVPWSSLFRAEEAHLVLLSDLGISIMLYALKIASQAVGWPMVAVLYVQPYLWVNHWIVAITYLHHTHPDVPRYEDEAWTFIKGATATIDRDFGWAGRYLLHNVVEYHVIHHLFPHIPFYYGEEATNAIRPLLGKQYRSERSRSLFTSLWESFTKCQYVEADDESKQPSERVMCFRGGPMLPPEIRMR